MCWRDRAAYKLKVALSRFDRRQAGRSPQLVKYSEIDGKLDNLAQPKFQSFDLLFASFDEIFGFFFLEY
jgi:hypothetical protein